MFSTDNLRNHLTKGLVLAAASIACFGAKTDNAEAGIYVQRTCDNGVTDGWSSTASPKPYTSAVNYCSSGTGLYGASASAASVSADTVAYWDWDAPDNTKLTGFSIYRRYQLQAQATGSSLYSLQTTHSEYINYVLTTSGKDSGWGTESSAPGTLNTDNIRAHAWCSGAFGCTNNPAAQFWIKQAYMFISDPNSPTVSSVTGSLESDESLKGTESLYINAGDLGGGISKYQVEIDGEVVAQSNASSNSGKCASSETASSGQYDVYSYRVPCALSDSGSVSLDTTTLSEGEHDLRVLVVDVARNSSVALSREVVVDNVVAPEAPIAGGSSAGSVSGSLSVGSVLTCNRGSFVGDDLTYSYQWYRSGSTISGASSSSYTITSGDVGHSLSCTVTASNSDGSASESLVAGVVSEAGSAGFASAAGSGAANGKFASDDATVSALFSRSRSGSLSVRFGGRVRISGVIVDRAGRGITGAEVSVLSRVRSSVGVWRVVDRVVTDGSGGFSYLTRRGPSRDLRFAYASSVGSDTYADVSDVVLKVRAAARFGVSRRTVTGGSRVLFKGTLRGGYCPARGKVVELQWHDRGRWKVFSTTRAGKNCRFRYRYRFVGAVKQPVGVKFRARLRDESTVYPYTLGYSNTLKIRIKP